MATSSPSWSCDSFVVMPDAAATGRLLFGKNSDRPARECQPLRRVAARSGGGTLQLAYLRIPDADLTYDHVASSPYWCWGHEIAMNSRGVVIGNEALFTRDLAATAAADRRAVSGGAERPVPGLLGMELLRLGVERGGTAAEAVEVITGMLERYGQWGAGTTDRDRASAAYDNAYAIADSQDAYVLETTGRDWAVRRVQSGTAAISNEPTIRTDWTGFSSGLENRARSNRWPGTGSRLDVAEAITDPGTPLQVSHIRLQRSRQLLDSAATTGGVDWAAARGVLSDHYEQTFLSGPAFNAARPDFLTLCMHASPAGFTWGNTAASVIAVPGARQPYWWWAATTPCTSIYLPVAVVGSRLPAGLGHAGTAADAGPDPESAALDEPVPGSYWWTFQLLLEAVCGDHDGVCYADRQPRVRRAFDPLQAEFLAAADDLDRAGAGAPAWDGLTRECAEAAQHAAQQLLAEFSPGSVPSVRG
jgi:secernin